MKSCANALSSNSLPSDSPDAREWFNLRELAGVEVSSEADGYPVESAFIFGAGPGWRAASPGKQRIRLAFDEPQWIQRMRLRFNELEVARTRTGAKALGMERKPPLQEMPALGIDLRAVRTGT